MHRLPAKLYTKQSVAALDKAAIASGIPGYTLMRRAGAALVNCLHNHFDSNSAVLIVCGAGNNAGDGYVLARLAKQQGWQVTLASVIDVTTLKGDALIACQHWQEVGTVTEFSAALLDDCDIVVDALLGTGLARDVEGDYLQCIEAINRCDKPVIAVDIPSGLNANTGCIQAAAIDADMTVSFIGLKQGMFTASGKQCCGEVLFDDLSVPDSILQQQQPSAQLVTSSLLAELPARRHDSHKNQYGHVLVIGGNTGMVGAVVLAATAALRAGAGLVTVVTLPEHVAAVASVCPELMVVTTTTGEVDERLFKRVTHIVAGPGMGQDAWSTRLMYQLARQNKPVLYDADALNLIARSQQMPTNASVITPHPGEAAKLLECNTGDVQADRFSAAARLCKKYVVTTVLKGSGSIIADAASEETAVCAQGTPAMATAGMGDVLSGVIGALLAQRVSPALAARTGVVWHAVAAELAADGADRGLLATDVIAALPSALKISQ